MLLSKKNLLIYVIFASCLSSAFLIPFFNSSGFYPLSYLVPLLMFFPTLRAGGIRKDTALLISLLALLLLLNGSSPASIVFIASYLVVFSSITSEKFIRSKVPISRSGFIVILILSILYAISIGENFSSVRLFPRLKGYTLEASYLGMTVLGLWFIYRSSIVRCLILALIVATQSGLTFIGLLMRSAIYRLAFLLLFLALTAYLLFTPISEAFFLSNSFAIRLLGIISLKSTNAYDFLFGRGIGASDAQVGIFLEPFGISNYSGSFVFGVFSDFGLLSFTLLMIILTQRIPLALALLLLLNFSLASPYTLFISWAWCLGDAKYAELNTRLADRSPTCVAR
jgi:hypothetical protein